MQSALNGLSDRPRIVIADEDASVVQFVIQTLRKDGNAVFHAYDALSAAQLAFSLDRCDLLLSNTRVEGMPGYRADSSAPNGRTGYVVDHVIPLACGGADTPENMQWQRMDEAKAYERKNC